MRKKRAREGKSTDEIEHFPAPSAVTVRWRADVSVGEVIESKVKQINWILCFKNQTLDFFNFIFVILQWKSNVFGCLQSYSGARGSASTSKRQRIYNGSTSRQRNVSHHERDYSSGAEDDLNDDI